LRHFKALNTQIKAEFRHHRQRSSGQIVPKISIKKRDDHLGTPATVSQTI